jgi:hypothetical protein
MPCSRCYSLSMCRGQQPAGRRDALCEPIADIDAGFRLGAQRYLDRIDTVGRQHGEQFAQAELSLAGFTFMNARTNHSSVWFANEN